MLRAYLRRQSLKQKLPLLLCGLLLSVVVLDSALSYRSVKNAALAVGHERLRSVTAQLGDALDKSIRITADTLRAEAADSAIGRFIESQSAGNRAAALAALRRTSPTSAQRIVAELYDEHQHLMLSGFDTARSPHADARAEMAEVATGPRFLSIGRMRVDRDTIVIPIAAAVLRKGVPAGYYLEWRRVASTPQARDQLLKLIGPDAALLVGNDSGNVWTDLAGAVRGPRINVRDANSIVTYNRPDGKPVFAAPRPIAGAPWFVVIEFPSAGILASADDFLKRSAVIGLVLIAFGFAVALSMSRSITTPLKHLTDAANAIAAGDSSSAVDVSRSDELGQLAEAFNVMASQVRGTRQTLEHRVAERTQRLEQLQVVMLRTERLNTLATIGAGLAHDLNNLIFTITLAVQLLQEDAATAPRERSESLARIRTATAEARKLTQRLMSFARGEGGDSEPAQVDVSAAVAEQEDLLRMLLPRTVGLRVLLEGTGRRLLLPRSLIEQTLVNLVSNARDAMPDGGLITVRLREELSGGQPFLLLEVSDTGHGIAPELHERIFETFFTTKEEQGTGIGLASVRALMTSIGGTVSVHSAAEAGATFRLSFPIETHASTRALAEPTFL